MGEGKRLQNLLKDRGITVAALARDSGISANTLYALIKRDSNVSIAQADKIAKALNMSAGELNILLAETVIASDTITLYKIDEELDKLKDIQGAVQRINDLTKNHRNALMRLAKEQEAEKKLVLQRVILEKQIEKARQQIKALETDIDNRETELKLIKLALLSTLPNEKPSPQLLSFIRSAGGSHKEPTQESQQEEPTKAEGETP